VPYLRDVADAPLRSGRIWQHIGIYAYAREALQRWVALPPHPLELIERLEQLRPLAAGLAMGVSLVDEAPRVGIDTDADLVRANAEWTDFEGRL
jgi:3-deoxy-manno-octulosonate cytidylyltransferase (CMP-KDO synthetase)